MVVVERAGASALAVELEVRLPEDLVVVVVVVQVAVQQLVDRVAAPRATLVSLAPARAHVARR